MTTLTSSASNLVSLQWCSTSSKSLTTLLAQARLQRLRFASVNLSDPPTTGRHSLTGIWNSESLKELQAGWFIGEIPAGHGLGSLTLSGQSTNQALIRSLLLNISRLPTLSSLVIHDWEPTDLPTPAHILGDVNDDVLDTDPSILGSLSTLHLIHVPVRLVNRVVALIQVPNLNSLRITADTGYDQPILDLTHPTLRYWLRRLTRGRILWDWHSEGRRWLNLRGERMTSRVFEVAVGWEVGRDPTAVTVQEYTEQLRAASRAVDREFSGLSYK